MILLNNEKEKIISKSLDKQKKIFGKKSNQIEYNPNDISIDVSELKDRVLSTVGGLDISMDAIKIKDRVLS